MASRYGIDQETIVKRLTFDRVVQLTNDAGGDTIDTDNLDEAIAGAEDEFDLYAGVYFVTPVRDASDAVPAGLRRKLIELVCWYLMMRRAELLKNSNDEGDLWKGRREELLTWMEGIGPTSLPGAVKLTAPGGSKLGTATVISDAPRFSADRMVGFH